MTPDISDRILRFIFSEIFPESDSRTQLITWEHPKVALADADGTLYIDLEQYHVTLDDDFIELNYLIEAAYRRASNVIWYRNVTRLAQGSKL